MIDMVSFHTPLSPTPANMIPDVENSSKKRKWGDESQADNISGKPSKTNNMKSIFDTHLHFDTPLPLEWQRCLDIKSGQIYFYNTSTRKRTSKDPRIAPEPPSPGHMSLDLELNLPCGSVGKNHGGDNFRNSSIDDKKSNMGGLLRSPSWLTFEGDNKEMVTAVCKKCHMLVMMLKSSPACPNCKFMHPPDQSPHNMFNPRLSLLC